MKARILLAEDEDNIREAIKLNLELEGYEVVAVNNGKKALDRFSSEHFNVVILDVMMPEMDGFTVCEQMRLKNVQIPVLFLTAKDNPSDKIQGLKLGADDYITKPFNLEELLLRVRIMVKHSMKGTANEKELSTFKIGPYEVNLLTMEAESNQGKVHLTKKEIQLLKLLVSCKNEVVSREKILQYVWGYDVYPSTRSIDNFITNFRKYFEPDPHVPVYFHSVRSVGYKYTDAVLHK